MQKTILYKLESISERHEELAALLSDPAIIQNQDQFRSLSKEYAEAGELVSTFRAYRKCQEDIRYSEHLMQDSDPEIRALAEEEMLATKDCLENLEKQLSILLLPKDPNDGRNIFLEIRAGTGGDEAAIFAGDLFRMYSRYAETKGWQVEMIHANYGDHGGYKEIVARISGNDVYSHLKFESGTHRVQRVPDTESQGRIHTSACTVAILPELEEVEEINIDTGDLRIDTFRASGAGGQHINKTDSAIRITHIPSGIVVECQDERSQHKNRARALALLKAKLLDIENSKLREERAESRRLQVGSGDRSERIRTYNYPQARVTDHRINLTLYKLPQIMEGDLSQVIEPLMQEFQADQLATLEQKS